MVEALERLLELQRLDDQLIALEGERDAAPERHGRIAARRADCDARLDAGKQSLRDAEAAQRRAEQDLQEQEALHTKLESQQHQVKSNEAYTALLQEMEAARQAISDCETRILEGMEGIEGAKAALEEAERQVAEERGQLDAEERALTAREEEVGQGIARLRGEREAFSDIPAPLLQRYERVSARRRPAVVVIRKEVCAGCQVDIPAQAFIEILRGEEIVACGTCTRILVHEEKLSAPKAM